MPLVLVILCCIELVAATGGVIKKVKKFAKLIGKHLFQSLFFNKVAGLRPLYYKRESGAVVNFGKLLKVH